MNLSLKASFFLGFLLDRLNLVFDCFLDRVGRHIESVIDNGAFFVVFLVFAVICVSLLTALVPELHFGIFLDLDERLEKGTRIEVVRTG